MDDKKIEELIKIWQNFTDSKDFKLNPDKEIVNHLAKGVLDNEKNKGFKYCPCRMTKGDKEEDFKLICPCNFKTQNLR